MKYNQALCTLAQQLMQAAAATDDAQAFLDANHPSLVALAIGVSEANIRRRCVISSWTALTNYLRSRTLEMGREEFRVLFLDKKNQLILDECMGKGTVDHAPVYPREIARRALELDACAVILTHNHPSGDPSPSAADIEMTRQVVSALRALGITVHDHIITGATGMASFKALGLM